MTHNLYSNLIQVTVGDRVVFIEDGQPKHGVVRWTGILEDFPNNLMVGIQYDFPLGKTDGSYRGKTLFNTKANYGAFVPRSSLILEREFYAARSTQSSSNRPIGGSVRASVTLPAVVSAGDKAERPLPVLHQNGPKPPVVGDTAHRKESLGGSRQPEGFVELEFMKAENKGNMLGPFAVAVQPTFSMSSLKHAVASRYGFPSDQQTWVIHHKVATDDQILATLGIWDSTGVKRPYLYVMPKVQTAKPSIQEVPIQTKKTEDVLRLKVTLKCGDSGKTWDMCIPASKSKRDLGNMIIKKTDYIPCLDGWSVNGVKTACDDRSFASCGIKDGAKIVIHCNTKTNGRETVAIPKKVAITKRDLEKRVDSPTVYNVHVHVKGDVEGSFQIMINRHTKFLDMQTKVYNEYNILPDFQWWKINERTVRNADPHDLFQKFGTFENCRIYVRKFETGWSCPACTLINPATRPGCMECSTARPENYVPPLDLDVDEAERIRMQREAEADRTLREEEERERQEKGRVYAALISLDNAAVVLNTEDFVCSICGEDTLPGDGVVLRECLHSFCLTCLQGTVRHCEEPFVKCPYFGEFSCEAVLQLREVQSIVSDEDFAKLLERSLKVAEGASGNSFHCRTPNCEAWCEYDDDVNVFQCPLCKAVNCITCRTIHHPKTCKEYQDWAELHGDSDGAEAAKSKDFLRGVLENGTAMRCPGCRLVIVEKTGCDWVCCPNCRMEICWATKGPRWGPKGHGDISGGCKCRVNGQLCRPNCGNCH